jgi:ATP dependent DNA ligase domain
MRFSIHTVACDESGVPSFERIRYRRHDTRVFLYAFDLIELNGDDLRRNPLEVRKTTLATVLTGASHGIWYNDHVEGDGQTVFRHACKLGLEGIVSKRKDSPYCSGRSPDWLKDEEPGALGGEAGGGRGLGAGDVFAVQACVGEPPIRRVERRRFTTLSPTALSSARIFHAAASPVGVTARTARTWAGYVPRPVRYIVHTRMTQG